MLPLETDFRMSVGMSSLPTVTLYLAVYTVPRRGRSGPIKMMKIYRNLGTTLNTSRTLEPNLMTTGRALLYPYIQLAV
jgi:hypothetical protein